MQAHNFKKSIPLEVVVLILEVALAAPVSIPPSASDRQLRTSVLLLSRNFRDTFIKRIYNTVVLWSESAIRNFAETVCISRFLGSLVLNLWAGNRGITNSCAPLPGNSETDDCVGWLEDIMSATPNLQRLYIAFGGSSPSHKIQCRIPDAVRHLAVPQYWLSRGTLSISLLETGKGLSNLASVRMRGHFSLQEVYIIMKTGVRPLQLILEIYDEYEYADPRKFRLFLRVLSHLRGDDPRRRSVEVILSPNGFERFRDVFAEVEVGNPEGVSLLNQGLDDETQLDVWLSNGERSQATSF